MPKLKTRKSAAKRFKVTGTGKYKRQQSGLKHNLSHKNAAGKRAQTPDVIVFAGDEKRIDKMLPYRNY